MHPSLLRIIFSSALILALKIPGADAFMTHSERLTHPHRRSGHRYLGLPSESFPMGSRLLASSSDEDGDDDGWGVTSSKSDQERELAALQAERAESSASSNRVRQGSEQPEERDLFIPIFAVVSLAGLFGSYGYEMLRLHSRGELYLPWDQ